MKAYKGFDKNWACRGFVYGEPQGQSFEHDGEVSLCNNGFHACEYPLDVFGYYDPTGKFAEVELAGVSKEADSDSKRVAKKITLKAALTIPLIVSAAIEYTIKRCDPVKAQHSKGDQSASSATGDQSASSATGDQSASSATGYRSASSATGDRSASSATGYRSASSATGDQSASSATGYRSASSATGDRSASSATGDRSASSATGDRSASSATGNAAVAMNIGYEGKARASKGGAIVLCNHDSEGNIRHIRASKVGENGIKEDVFYKLNASNQFEEA